MSVSTSNQLSPRSLDAAESRVCRRVAIVGFGTVGRAVARILTEGVDGLRLTHIFNRGIDRKRVAWTSPDVRWTERFEDVLGPDVDLVVEVVGGVSPAGDWVRRALAAGKSVVTANKQLIAQEGDALVALARRSGAALRFEASVGGVIPVLRAVQEGLAADRLVSLGGILNGTCNHILSRMAAGSGTYDDALLEAQTSGLAESDPTADVDGMDARAKLAILIAVGLRRHVAPPRISCRSIRPIEPIDFAYARRLGSTIRQIAWAELDPASNLVRAWVRPALVPRGSRLGSVMGSDNLVLVRGQRSGETAYGGHGAGGDPTAVAVVSDLVTLAQTGTSMAYAEPSTSDLPMDSDCVAPHYIRFMVDDRPGIVAAVAAALARRGLNIDAVLQEPGFPKSRLPFVVTLEPCPESTVEAALMELAAHDFQVVPPVLCPLVSGEHS